MEESQQVGYESKPSYWPSVFIAAGIFGFIFAAANLVQGYMTINSGTQTQWIGNCICVVVAFAGMVAVWHYANEYEIPMTLGRGALIGFFAGAIASLIGFGLLEIWNLLDPSYAEALKNVQIVAIEQNDQIPDEWKQRSIDYINNPSTIMTALFIIGPALLIGILSMLTGMLGVKFFAKKETL